VERRSYWRLEQQSQGGRAAPPLPCPHLSKRERANVRLRERYDLRGFWFLAPALVLLALSVAFPLFRVFQRSFQEFSSEASAFQNVGIQQYRDLVGDPLFWTSLRNTLVFTLGSIGLHLGIAFPIALFFNARWPSLRVRNFFRGVVILPFLFSPPAAALLWGLLFRPLGPINYGLTQLFGASVSFLGDPNWALFSVMLVNAWVYFPLYMILILGGLQSIPPMLHDAARVDGAGWLQRVVHVTIPHLRNLLMTIVIIDFATSFVHFDLVWTMTKGGPLRSTYLISFFLYEKGLADFRYGYGSAVGVVIASFMAVCIVAYVLLLTRQQERTA
jgi:multiple sugar transport system permease protein